ncbi:MAG: 7-cyano-7-deazaguanine synthase QueC [Phycisphaerales bacterium]|nr:7-cyano-7-deazaguanine synthase QueC [Phycisphaerales bacterium]
MQSVLIYSGGLDSTVLLYYLRDAGHELRCLGIDYGQRHRRELGSAAEISRRLGVEYRMADLAGLRPLLAVGALTGADAVPEGHYNDESMKLTIVPNRNMIMLSVAIGWAISLRFDAVAYAAHAGDHPIYPDCRPEFVESVEKAAALCDWHPVRILRPFIEKSKTDLVRLGAKLGVPFALTWSCYKGGERHCGRCGTCTERREAFQLAGVPDPTEYAA